MKRNIWFFLLWINAAWLLGQTPQQTFEFAQLQQRRGETASALEAYQRVLFFAREQYGLKCYAALAELFKQSGAYDRSLYYYELLYHAAPNDSLRYEAVFSKAGLLLLTQSHKNALIELLSIDAAVPEPWQSRRALYLGACYFGLRDFAQARAVLAPLVEQDVQKQKAFLQIFERSEKIARKSPKTARILSMGFPGAGQLYAGDVKNGLNSMLLNGGLIAGFVAMAVAYTVPDAILTVSPWLFRYYAGGFKRAGAIVEQKKDERLKRQFLKIVDVLKH
jgi:tetratricopeptide (TPR) repeat protein